MAILDILHFPDTRLRNIAKPVAQVDDSVRKLIDDMFETMYQAPGIGLAAIQVNQPRRVIVVDISEERNQPLALINPEILDRQGEEEMDEGCLSVPGVYEKVQRAERVRVRALDREGIVRRCRRQKGRVVLDANHRRSLGATIMLPHEIQTYGQ